MSAFTQINLARLPAPQVVSVPDYEDILAEMKSALVAQAPELADVLELESEPALKVLQVCAYYVMLSRAEKNDAARAVMLPFAKGSDLDNLGALLGVERAVIMPAEEDANPPVAAVMEEDDRFRDRIQLSLEGFSTAGPVGSYLFHALSASPEVRDASIASPTPGQVMVTVLATSGDGTPSSALLDLVNARLNDEDVRPLTDQVTVQAAQIIPYTVTAHLTIKRGPDPAAVIAAAEATISEYTERRRALGAGAARSGLFGALHQEGVDRVTLSAPEVDQQLTAAQSGICTNVELTWGLA